MLSVMAFYRNRTLHTTTTTPKQPPNGSRNCRTGNSRNINSDMDPKALLNLLHHHHHLAVEVEVGQIHYIRYSPT